LTRVLAQRKVRKTVSERGEREVCQKRSFLTQHRMADHILQGFANRL
jgi:hypothetical protein